MSTPKRDPGSFRDGEAQTAIRYFDERAFPRDARLAMEDVEYRPPKEKTTVMKALGTARRAPAALESRPRAATGTVAGGAGIRAPCKFRGTRRLDKCPKPQPTPQYPYGYWGWCVASLPDR